MPEEEQFNGGAYYVNFPDYANKVRGGIPGALGHSVDWAIKSSGLDDVKIPLGHAGVVSVDKNGNTRYYEFGRYSSNDPSKIGVSVKGGDAYSGNWTRKRVPNVPKVNGKFDSQAFADALEKKFGKNIELVHINDADPAKIDSAAVATANDPHRREYSLFGANCGSEAERIIEESTPSHGWFSDLWYNTFTRGFMPNTKSKSFHNQGYKRYTGNHIK